MHAEHAAKGQLQSSATVRRAIQITEEFSYKYLDDAIEAVAEIAKDVEAFNLLAAKITASFRTLETHVRKAARLACGSANKEPAPSVLAEADRLFAETRDQVLRQLEIQRFSFVQPSKSQLATTGLERIGAPAPEQAVKNPGGKPLAKHWDAMWASIAVQLYEGDLKPNVQADIERAMLDWFARENITIGETSVRGRARQLWQKISESE